MTLLENLYAYVGTPNDYVGEIIIVTLAGVTFLILVEGFMYMMWKYSTGRWG